MPRQAPTESLKNRERQRERIEVNSVASYSTSRPDKGEESESRKWRILRRKHRNSRRKVVWAQQDSNLQPTDYEASDKNQDAQKRQEVTNTEKDGATPVATCPPDDPDLERLIAAWPKIPRRIREAILHLIGVEV